MIDDPQLSRRALMVAGGGLAIGTGAALRARMPDGRIPSPEGETCFLMPDVVDGPYYMAKALARRDIAQGRAGIALDMKVRIVDAACRPIAGARVDTWQADAQGIYSGYARQGDDLQASTIGQDYLRGTQLTHADGWVLFQSIFPGWYRGRTAHVHFKIYIGGHTRLTAQMYFPDALNEFIYTQVPGYTRALTRDTVNVADWILAEGTHGSMANIREETDRYVSSITFGVDSMATPAPSEMPPMPGGAMGKPAGAPPPSTRALVGAERIDALIPSPATLTRPRPATPGSRPK